MRALVITNMYPSTDDPARGSFVRDQVEALRSLPGTEIELFAFASRGASAYAEAARQLRRRYRAAAFDVIHAHFGLTLWPALALRRAPHAVTLHGTDLVHPRSRAITLAGLRFADLVAPVSEALAQLVPDWAVRGRQAILPMGVNTDRFRPIDRLEARRALGLDEAGPYLLFPADPSRAEKRFDRAREVAGDTQLLTLGHVEPAQVPLWVNAANAVLVPSERESFGLSVFEALACDVPVLATPVGVAQEALSGVAGAYCAPFDPAAWSAVLEPLLAQPDPRVASRPRAEKYSARAMAERVLAAWRSLA
ncbi:MAG TPA: glycosyltransferase [Solirubrobacteraceae bacterium]|nr:glycosyltransferase [Solirubrobacteraceae bacterium]